MIFFRGNNAVWQTLVSTKEYLVQLALTFSMLQVTKFTQTCQTIFFSTCKSFIWLVNLKVNSSITHRITLKCWQFQQLATAIYKNDVDYDSVPLGGDVIDWSGVCSIDRERDMTKRRLREAVWIKRKETMMNWDEGAIYLLWIWHNVVACCAT